MSVIVTMVVLRPFDSVHTISFHSILIVAFSFTPAKPRSLETIDWLIRLCVCCVSLLWKARGNSYVLPMSSRPNVGPSQQQPVRGAGTAAVVPPPPSAQMEAVMRVLTGQEERTLAQKLADPNRPTWEQYKKDNVDKLNLEGVDAKKMEEYRQQLDAERDKILARGTNHKPVKSAKDKKKKKKRKRHHSSDSSSDDVSEDDDESSERSDRKKKKHKKRKKKHKKT
jgi:hypothetical protein